MNYVLPLENALISAMSWEIDKGRMKDGRYDAFLIYQGDRVKEIKYVPSKKEFDDN